MSSPIYTASCLARAGCLVDIEVGTVQYAMFPCSRLFSLGVLWEASESDVYRAPGVLWPRADQGVLGAAFAVEEIWRLASADVSEEDREAFAARYVKAVGYVATRNWTPGLWPLVSSGVFVDPKVPTTDPRWTYAEAALQQVVTHSFGGRSLDELDDAEAAAVLPHATLRIEVTDARWCAHLEAGMLWDGYFDDATAPVLL